MTGNKLLVFIILFLFLPSQAYSAACPAAVRPVSASESAQTKTFVDTKFSELQAWYESTFWNGNVLPSLQAMTAQLSAVAMQQVQIIGGFIDAKHQLETQQILQKLQARAHKDYQPSEGMCTFGSSVISLAASERKSDFVGTVMSQYALDRAQGKVNIAAATGAAADFNSRIDQFRKKFCNPADNNNGMALLCDWDQNPQTTGQIGGQQPTRHNKDIDYVRTLAAPWSLKIDFTDNTLTPEEEEVIALAGNLYGHEIPISQTGEELKSNFLALENPQRYYMDMRSYLAKRNVAQNSYNAIVAMKSEGTPGSTQYLKAILQELGIDPATTGQMTAATANSGSSAVPTELSYYAQMEVLTKKIFQNPDFYTNLYDKPANVARKNVALQAVGLMQKFDLFKSYLRNEASLSVLLELAVMDLQDDVENQLAGMKSGETPAKSN